jgi:predicted ester cyclase
MTNEAAATVLPFYTKALTVNTETTSTAVLEQLLADDFESIDSHERKSKAVLIKQVAGFWQLIPDLRWEPQDVIASGTKVVVRSVATGAPNGNFMGMALDGSKSFRIDTTDIHELVNGRITRVHHLEGWAAALKQLATPVPTPSQHCIEIARFELRPGVTDEQLLAVERKIRGGRIAKQPGFISRELGKDPRSNAWLMIMRFATRPQVDAWLAELKGVVEMRELGGLINMDTMTSHSFTRSEP